MTAAKVEVVQPYAAPHLLAPGTVTRPGHIAPADWARMGWHAKWRATRGAVPEAEWLLIAHTNRDRLDLRLALASGKGHDRVVRHSVAS